MKFIHQHDAMDCGPACLAMIADFYGKKYSLQYLRTSSFITREGVSLAGISEAAEKIGFDTFSAKVTIEKIKTMQLPCILHWNQMHFVVLHEIKEKRGHFIYKIADPGSGLVSVFDTAFKKSWASDGESGIVLFLNPTEQFFERNPPRTDLLSFEFLLSYLKPYTKQLSIMLLMLLLGSCVTFLLPFLTQNLIDKGVNKKNINVVELILIGQLFLFLGSLFIEIVRNSLALYVGSKINIKILSDYLKKLLKLPIEFFETKLMGDFNQRIQDHERIETFLTSQSLLTIFSFITFSAFLGVLYYYNPKILFIYLSLTILSVTWSYYFLRKRRILDYYRFQQRSDNQSSIFEIISGVTEMKLNQFENYKLNKWEEIQKALFKINLKMLRLEQFQVSGFEFINQLKNILVTFLSATYVIKGTLTLGELLSISFIVGQMNSPITQLINFLRSLQDAKLSLERLNEIQQHPNEEALDCSKTGKPTLIDDNFNKAGIKISNVSFRYGGVKSPLVLKDINIFIPHGTTTAIVGSSGSGKTTLMKLLLKFYEPTNGAIYFDQQELKNISPSILRSNCGVVMQEGFIFSDTIERNIATSDENVDRAKFINATQTANIQEYITSLPLQANTKIGASGSGISGGQKQRILIARAVYKNPNYIFFDEATSALDAENEKIIHDNLVNFFNRKTVVIIAHRLSTVKNADQVIVLKNGEIVEQGDHQQLIQTKGEYFNLVKNQLELGV